MSFLAPVESRFPLSRGLTPNGGGDAVEEGSGGGNPLSTAQVRYELRTAARAEAPGSAETRPFGLRGARVVVPPLRPQREYCPITQVAVDRDGRPLIETMGKAWATKASSDGDEGVEEDYGWEEESD